MRLLVIGASGRLGRLIVGEAMIRGHQVTGQSRSAARVPAGAVPAVGPPADAGLLAGVVPGHDAVIFALGVDASAPATLFSDATRVLLDAMADAGVRRLVAITGARGGETCSASNWLPSRVLYPLFGRDRHPDKDAQEALIAASDLDWTIIRPGPIADGPLKGGLHAVWPVPAHVQVAAVTRGEVAEVVLDAVEQHRWQHAQPLVGHFA